MSCDITRSNAPRARLMSSVTTKYDLSNRKPEGSKAETARGGVAGRFGAAERGEAG